jgi:hydrogenase maturation protease
MAEKATVVIGIGNADRGDDAVGLLVARRLREKALPNVRVFESTGDPADLLQRWGGNQRMIAIDAMVTGGEPGSIRIIDASEIDTAAALFRSHSTHSFGLAETVRLARALGCLPSHLTIVGIEGSDFGVGERLSKSMEHR